MLNPYTFNSNSDIELTIDLREHTAQIAETEKFADEIWEFIDNGIAHVTLQVPPHTSVHEKTRRLVDDIEHVEFEQDTDIETTP